MNQIVRTFVRGAAIAVALTTAVGLSACSQGSGDPAPSTAPAPTQLDLIVSVHANTPAPGLPSELGPLLQSAIAAAAPISVIALDGTPAVVYNSGAYTISDVNGGAKADDIAAQQNAVLAAVAAAHADSDGSDLSTALRVAKDQATAVNVADPTIVIVDSGLPDSGVPDLTSPGMTLADPAEVATFVAENKGLPDLAGSTIDLVGFGYTAAPQQQLSGAQRDNLTAIWKTLLTQAGAARVEVLPVPRSGDGPQTSFTTKTVDVPVDPSPSLSSTSTPAIYGDTSPLGFQPGSDEFRDPEAASAVIDQIAAWLTASESHTATIVGTTAGTDTIASQIALGTSRAEKVAAEVIARGAHADQITATGVGTQWPGYVNDVRADGTLDPGLAALNRTTQITLGIR